MIINRKYVGNVQFYCWRPDRLADFCVSIDGGKNKYWWQWNGRIGKYTFIEALWKEHDKFEYLTTIEQVECAYNIKLDLQQVAREVIRVMAT